jgi:hypothetical protein
MSDQLKKHLTDAGAWAFKGILSIVAALAIFIFNEMRSAITEIGEVVTSMSAVVVRLDEKVDRNIQDIKENKDDIKRLDEKKADKK